MKLIYIANARIPTEKAHGFQISKTCEKFSDFGVDVELWTPTRKNAIKEDLFSFYGIKRNFVVRKIHCLDFIFLSKYVGSLAFYFQSLFFSFKIFFLKIPVGTVVYSRDFLIIILLNLKGIKTVYNAHNWSKKRGLFLKLFLNKNSKIVCNSKGTRNEFIKRGYKNIISVPNGVDLEKFDFIKEAKEEIRKKLNLLLDKKIILYLGHLYKWKGVDVIFELAEKNKDGDIFFVLVGGTQKDLEMYNKKIEERNIKNIILLGHKPQKETPYYLKSADVLLLPNVAISEESEKFTSPIKMFEYMASGVPIVASDLQSIREILNEGNSILVKAGDSNSLLLGINKFLEDDNLAKKVSNKAEEDAKKYTWDEYIKKILDFIVQNI